MAWVVPINLRKSPGGLCVAMIFTDWFSPQPVPEPLKHLQLRGFCTFMGPIHKNGLSDRAGVRCLNLCLRPVCLREKGHSDHYCENCLEDGGAKRHKALLLSRLWLSTSDSFCPPCPVSLLKVLQALLGIGCTVSCAFACMSGGLGLLELCIGVRVKVLGWDRGLLFGVQYAVLALFC